MIPLTAAGRDSPRRATTHPTAPRLTTTRFDATRQASTKLPHRNTASFGRHRPPDASRPMRATDPTSWVSAFAMSSTQPSAARGRPRRDQQPRAGMASIGRWEAFLCSAARGNERRRLARAFTHRSRGLCAPTIGGACTAGPRATTQGRRRVAIPRRCGSAARPLNHFAASPLQGLGEYVFRDRSLRFRRRAGETLEEALELGKGAVLDDDAAARAALLDRHGGPELLPQDSRQPR